MTYDEWKTTASKSVRSDPTWKVEAYRLGLFAGDAAWADTTVLIRDPRGAAVAGQLMRAAASVAAQIAEGYGRRSAKDRVRYYEYALGSVGETRAWYATVRHAIGVEAMELRMANLLSLTRLLLTMIRRERDKPADWMDRDREH
ncbi:MAG: four helix bundle protein [Gemmatimonadaceae bacterium]